MEGVCEICSDVFNVDNPYAECLMCPACANEFFSDHEDNSILDEEIREEYSDPSL